MSGWWSRLVVVALVGLVSLVFACPAFADTPSPSPSSASAEVSPSTLPVPPPVAGSPTYSGSGPLDADDREGVLDWMTAMLFGMGFTVLASSAGVVLLVRR